MLAQLASATIHTIAIRARAQMPRKQLEAIVKGAIDVMVGARRELDLGPPCRQIAGKAAIDIDRCRRGDTMRSAHSVVHGWP